MDSACVAAVVRLKTTVDFAETEDQMYYIGPLLFWACAEMTCGFFIICVPCLPKLISDSACATRIKKALGFSAGAAKPTYSNQRASSKFSSKFGTPYGSRKRNPSADILHTTTVDASPYLQIDEEVGLDDLNANTSTEHLRKSHQNGGGVYVTKTVLVTKSTSSSAHGHASVESESDAPWARPAK